MLQLEPKYNAKTIVYVGAPLDNCKFSGLNVTYMNIVFGRDRFPRPVELTVHASFRRIFLRESH